MSNYFLGEVRLFGFNFPPRGWLACNGQILPIAQNTALFSLLGTTYGGNGSSTFGLPDLRGRVALGMGTGPGLSTYDLGETGGVEDHTLDINEMPAHAHQVACGGAVDNSAGPTSPVGNFWTKENNGDAPYSSAGASLGVMNASAVATAGGSQPHSNQQPSLTVNFCIATTGYYPSRN